MIRLLEVFEKSNKLTENELRKLSKTKGKRAVIERVSLLEDVPLIDNFLHMQKVLEDIIRELAELDTMKDTDIEYINIVNTQCLNALCKIYGIISTQETSLL